MRLWRSTQYYWFKDNLRLGSLQFIRDFLLDSSQDKVQRSWSKVEKVWKGARWLKIHKSWQFIIRWAADWQVVAWSHTSPKLSLFILTGSTRKDADEKASITGVFFIRGDWFYSAKCLLDGFYSPQPSGLWRVGERKIPRRASAIERRVTYFIAYIGPDIFHPRYLSDQ